VSFAAITLCVASQRVFVVVVSFVIDSVRKLLDIPLHLPHLLEHRILSSVQFSSSLSPSDVLLLSD
jgi:hypothetical protein